MAVALETNNIEDILLPSTVLFLNRLTVKEYPKEKIAHPKLHVYVHEDSKDFRYRLYNLFPFLDNPYDPHKLAHDRIMKTAKFCGFNLVYSHLTSRFENNNIFVEGNVDFYIRGE